MTRPKLIQKMKMHLNGGSKWSQLNYSIYADDVDTGIKRVTRTNGSPKYLKTEDYLFLGDEVFDIMATKGKGMIDWILARIPKEDKHGPLPGQSS